jgi:MOSC domain-containing protein YiiM
MRQQVGRVVSVNTSPRKGVRKKPVDRARVVENQGLEGDAHGGEWHRQVSLLALESIEKMRAKGLDVGPGDFAENLTTEGIDLLALPLGSRIRVGDEVELEITQIGKVCHTKCAIFYQAGDCVMPKEGVFAIVLREGDVADGDVVAAEAAEPGADLSERARRAIELGGDSASPESSAAAKASGDAGK